MDHRKPKNGQTAVLNIIAQITKTNTNITNTATLNQTNYNPNPQNQANNTITIEKESQLNIKKTVNNTKPHLNNKIIYTITVTNNGPDDTTNVFVTDILPQGLKFISTNGNYNPQTGIWTIGNLKNGQTAVLNIIAQITKTNTNITNTATLNQTNYNPNPQNQANNTINIEKESQLTIKKTVNNTKPHLNNKITYTITVTNNGPDDTTNVFVTDILPQGLKFISTNGNYNPQTGIWTIGNLQNGQTAVLNIIAQITKTNTNITNTATLNQTNYNPNPQNQANNTITIEKESQLNIKKTVNNTKPHLNNKIIYTITVTNNGPDDTTNVFVTDILPQGLKFISTNGNYNPQTGIWTIGNLKNGQTAVLNIIAQITKTNTNITNTATLNQTNYNPNPQNQANNTITIEKESVLAIKIAVNNSKPKLNDKITYTITVTNNGPDNTTNVTVTDILPQGLKFISTNGNYNPQTGIWTIGNLQNGQTTVLNIIAQITKTNTNITNTATLNQTNYNPNPQNQANNTITIENKSDPADPGSNSEGKTIPMQHTGVPIGGLVLAILVVIAGFMVPRSK
ncbi:conserved repeat domain protein [Methanobacterium lacus]|uniref:Conserved repeat domain protein n=1 Tax=Methanobacterium lacus (strain AL-21) TaxID=877455 RepID=F0T992_METLA|nr:DUF11 domain-containing protein [Methanobacterium lacus]ADZ09843.1 conserved repeat domain protein [Methanobacterium lacus]